jgi:hypothetical protein
MQRRDFIQGMVAGGTVLLSSSAKTARASEPPQLGSAPAPDGSTAPAACESIAPLFAPLSVGDEVGLGWSLTALTAVECGAATLALTHESTKAQVKVHVCRHHGEAVGAAHSDTLDFMLMNQGDGATVTDESLGRVLNVLSDVVVHNERAGVVPPTALLTHSERMARFREHDTLT